MYDLVAITASEYLIPNRRESKFINPLAYKQIPTSTNYYKYSFFPRTIIHRNALPNCIVLLPILAQFSHAVCQVVHHHILFLSFNSTIPLFRSTVQTHPPNFTDLFISATPPPTLAHGIRNTLLKSSIEVKKYWKKERKKG